MSSSAWGEGSYRFGIQTADVMSKDIIREYPDLFEITKIVSNYIEKQIGLPIPDGEIAYLALHFGSHLLCYNYLFRIRQQLFNTRIGNFI